MKSVIKVFPVNCGDAIRIIQKNNKGKTIGNILIDSGYIGTYGNLKEGICDTINNKSKIDLWILTHLDADHINGAVEFLRDKEINNKGKLIRKLWFNFFSPFEIQQANDFVSLAKGIALRELLKGSKIEFSNKIIASNKKIKVNNASLTILSPDKETYQELKEYWEDEEKNYRKVEVESYSANKSELDKKSIKDLAELPDPKISLKKDLTNRSSIAFLYETNREKVLFLGDAIPSVIVESLINLGYSKTNRLKVKYIKLSHHGSRANYNTSLLDYVDCNEFIISANGLNSHGIPDKEVLAKIILHPRRDFKKKIKFHFNYADKRFKNMFEVDFDEISKYNFDTLFPKNDKTLKLKL